MEAANEQIECPYKKRKLNEVDSENFCDDQADSIADNFETGFSEIIQNGDENKSDQLHDNQNIEIDENEIKDKENDQSDGNGHKDLIKLSSNNLKFNSF